MVLDVGVAITVLLLVELKLAPGLHVYVVPPETVNVADSPAQIVLFGEITNAEVLPTFTVISALVVQVPAPPITVYVVVMVGEATTLLPVDKLKLLLGLHVYELAPEAVNVADCPEQIVLEGDTTNVLGLVTFTVITALAVLVDEQEATLDNTVYVVVIVGDAITLLPVEELKDDEGLQVYVEPPETVNVEEDPKQIVLLGEIDKLEVELVTKEKLSTCVHRDVPTVLTLIYWPLLGAIKENTLLFQTPKVGTGPV